MRLTNALAVRRNDIMIFTPHARQLSVARFLWARHVVFATTINLACGSKLSTSAASPQRPGVLFCDTFEELDAVRNSWIAAIPDISGSSVSVEDRALKLTLPSSGEIRLSRTIDGATVRGLRLRVSARVRTDAPGGSGRISVSSGSSAPGYKVLVELPYSGSSWSPLSAFVDIDPDSVRIDLSLSFEGQGHAWFDDVIVERIGPVPERLTQEINSQQLRNVESLTRAAALIRYEHPSDQSASLDWESFLPTAIEQAIPARSRGQLLTRLRAIFAPIAPTAEFSEAPSYSLGEPTRGSGTHLSRWRHVGLGSQFPYSHWREGRDADQSSVRVEVLAETPNLSRCKRAQLHATGHRLGDDGDAVVYADIGLPGIGTKQIDLPFNPVDSSVSVDFEMPVDAYNVRLGVRVKGRAGFTLGALSLDCDTRDHVAVNIGQSAWAHHGDEPLYTYVLRACTSGTCLDVEHRPLDTAFVQARDVLDVQIADGLWLHLPLAVWTDGARTFPAVAQIPPPRTYATNDLAARLAIVASAWGTLSLFYPYFSDQHIAWSDKLAASLAGMANARSVTDVYHALFGLLTALRDNHARAYHPYVPNDGMIPVALRRFGDALVVVGTVDDYAKRIPIGTEILSLDHQAALQAYSDMRKAIPSATAQWSDAIVPFWLTVGPVGTLSIVRIRSMNGKTEDIVLPYLSRKRYESLVREPRPVSGSELAPGIRYVDLDLMKQERWQAILPSLSSARVIILDMRGYPAGGTLGILGHFVDKEIRSPEWQIPVLETGAYSTAFWTLRPKSPRLTSKVLVLLDGRAVSAAETFLQVVQDNHLATLIGETSAGTNGNVQTVPLPGGFSMRFTGMRVPRPDGTALQGHGVVPDQIVHPTLDGIRSGHDEILDAALALARRL
jgi:hypothetical protein